MRCARASLARIAFASVDINDAHNPSPELNANWNTLTIRQREAQLRHEAHLRQLQAAADLQAKQMELDRLRAEMAKVELQLEQQRDYEARQHREQLRHNAELRQWQTEQELKEKEIRAPGIAELEAFLDREIGMLAMERQRLRLEEEIRATNLARTRDFISRARRRKPEEADLSASGEEAQD